MHLTPTEFVNWLYSTKNDTDKHIQEIFNWFQEETKISIAHVVFSNMGLAEKPKPSISNDLRAMLRDADPSKMQYVASLTILTHIRNIDSLLEESKIFFDKTLSFFIKEMGEENAKKNLIGLGKID